MRPSPEFNRRRQARAMVTALALVGLVALIFGITIVRMHRG